VIHAAHEQEHGGGQIAGDLDVDLELEGQAGSLVVRALDNHEVPTLLISLVGGQDLLQHLRLPPLGYHLHRLRGLHADHRLGIAVETEDGGDEARVRVGDVRLYIAPADRTEVTDPPESPEQAGHQPQGDRALSGQRAGGGQVQVL
jgi:hypothetical protein